MATDIRPRLRMTTADYERARRALMRRGPIRGAIDRLPRGISGRVWVLHSLLGRCS